MAEPQPSKLVTRVRFPSPAPSVPGWRNGIRSRLKICRWRHREGSTPSPGTIKNPVSAWGGLVESSSQTAAVGLRTFRRLFLNAALLGVFCSAYAGVLCPPPNIETWEHLDGMVAEEYASLTNIAFIYPPRMVSGTNVWLSHIELWGGWRTFSPEGTLASITNTLQPTLRHGVPVWKMAVDETTDVSRVWLYTAADGTPFRTNDAPSALDPRQWVRDVYRQGPPAYLTGAEIDDWYENRDRSRFAFGFTLVASNDWPQLVAGVASAATNNPPPGNPPLRPPTPTASPSRPCRRPPTHSPCPSTRR